MVNSMTLRPRFIEELKRIAGEPNVLIDPEDLYVYSFQGPLGVRQGSKPNAVVRLHSEEEATKIAKLANNEGVCLIRRGAVREEKVPQGPIILDLMVLPNVSRLRDMLEKLKKSKIKENLVRVSEVGTSWSLLSFLESRLSGRLTYRCRECPKFTGTACSGYCTVAPFFDGIETWSSKGRLLLIRGLFGGDLKPTKKLVESIFTCTTCGQCYDQCILGDLELDRAIMFARYEIAKKGLSPEVFKEMPTRILERGTPIRTPLRTRKRTWWLDKLTEKPQWEEAEILYWIGCTTAYRFPNIAIATLNLLREANVHFTMFGEEEGCCGLILVHAGLWDEAKKNALRTVEKLKKIKVKTLITGCAGCYYAFKRVYPEILKVQVPLEVLHLSQFVESLVKNRDLKLRDLEMKVTYQDPCDLGRHCGVYDSPRNILWAIPSVRLVEMPLNKSHARCCGGGGGIWTCNTGLAMKIAYSKLIEEVLPQEVETIVTACPTCYMNLKYTSRLKKDRIKVYDLAEIIEKAVSS